ncbi:trigger factor [Actinomyces vulturis]|uniref:trigger factor n=1 Tax=Actinomyces vulturis TaxID=1857645 RepID=UPI0008333084|nr:trigger factor [Actinomyces vulturis]
MKTTVENLDPTRIKLSVEVPYETLAPAIDAAYKEIGSQIQVPGFRKGKVPAPVIDQRVGRAAVLDRAINQMMPELYRDAMVQADRVPMLQPEVEIADAPNLVGPAGGDLSFTAEVTVRPVFELPSVEGTELTVDAVEVTDEDVDAELENLRGRFASLKNVTRKAKTGDFVTIDLKAEIDGEEVDSASGISYEIGKGNMLKGLDTALRGLKAGESATFSTQLAGGPHEGEDAEVTVTATAVKQRDLPEADDDFAQEASEFDTIAELRESLKDQVRETKAADQAVAARDLLLDELLSKVEFDVPSDVVKAEIDKHLQATGKSGDEDAAKELEEDMTKGVREQILLDVLAEDLEVQVEQGELIEFLFQTAQQYGMEPGQFMQGAQRAGQIPAFVAEIARNKSLAMALRQVKVTDSAGNDVDLTPFVGSDEQDAAALVEQVEAAAKAAAAQTEADDAE